MLQEKASARELAALQELALEVLNPTENAMRRSIHQGKIVSIRERLGKTTTQFVINPGEDTKLIILNERDGKLTGQVHEVRCYAEYPLSTIPHRPTFDSGRAILSEDMSDLVDGLPSTRPKLWYQFN
jgi:hypothetical protein